MKRVLEQLPMALCVAGCLLVLGGVWVQEAVTDAELEAVAAKRVASQVASDTLADTLADDPSLITTPLSRR
jgi:hypothetical protein